MKTIGFAVCDPGRTVATPLRTIRRTRFGTDAAEILRIADERAIAGLVIGLPLNMDGTAGARAQSARTFAINLGKRTDLPIALWDERLSTAAAERSLIDLDVSRRKRAAVIDSHAAGFILQGALDRLQRMQEGGKR